MRYREIIKSKLAGYLFLLVSVLSFSLMAVLVKHLYQVSEVSPSVVALFRFVIGFGIVAGIAVVRRKPVRANSIRNVLTRAVLNYLAVISFFVVISLIPVTKANLYNMTYPIFVALIAHVTIGERLTWQTAVSVLVGFVGVILVINPEQTGLYGLGDVLGIFSGFVAGAAIVALKHARMTDDPFTILFYLMGIGFLISLGQLLFGFRMPDGRSFLLLVIIALLSFAGQYTITFAYRYVTSVEGAVVSSLRIFVVALLGVMLFGDILSTSTLIGGSLIFVSIVIVNARVRE